MTAERTSELDAEELWHLAILDIDGGRHDSAIEKLKQAVAQKPDRAEPQFLLAAEYAQIGLFDRAAEGMQRALRLDPELHVARFQLGLLRYQQGQIEQAREVWAPLQKLGESSLNLFQEALLKIHTGELSTARDLLQRARAAEKANLALVKEIEKVLANVDSHLGQAPIAKTEERGSAASHLLVHKYGEPPH